MDRLEDGLRDIRHRFGPRVQSPKDFLMAASIAFGVELSGNVHMRPGRAEVPRIERLHLVERVSPEHSFRREETSVRVIWVEDFAELS